MKLNEILLVNDQLKKPFQLSDIDQNTGQQIGTSENIPLWKYQTIKHDKQIVYALKINDELVTFIVGVPRQYDKPYFQVQQVWTDPAHRGKGYAPALYVTLIRKFHLALISDVEQTVGGKKVWDKLRTMVNVRVFDDKTRQFVDNITDKKLYSFKRYRLIAEHEEIFGNEGWLEQHGKYVDETSFEWYIPTILRDHEIFTHKNESELYDE